MPDNADRNAACRRAAHIYPFGLAVTFDGDVVKRQFFLLFSDNQLSRSS